MSSDRTSNAIVALRERRSRESNSRENAPLVPLHHISPFLSKWSVRVKVAYKSVVHTWTKEKGTGSFFNFEVHDGEMDMKVTAFMEQCRKFFDVVEEGAILLLSGGNLRPRNPGFNHTRFRYELILDDRSRVERFQAEDGVDELIPQLRPSFVRISRLSEMKINSFVDVLGIVKNLFPSKEIVTRNGVTTTKRDVELVDLSMRSVTLTLWGETAINFKVEPNQVLSVRRLKLSDFGGRSLSASSAAQFSVNPRLEEADILSQWWRRGGHKRSFVKLSNSNSSHYYSLKEAIAAASSPAKSSSTFSSCSASCDATVVFIRRSNTVYKACPDDDCNKKVTLNEDGTYRCAKCGVDNPSFKWRFMLSLLISDSTDCLWITSFQETSQSVLGVDADTLGGWQESDRSNFDITIDCALLKKFSFKLRLKEEMYRDSLRMRGICVSAAQFDAVACGLVLDQKISELAQKLGL